MSWYRLGGFSAYFRRAVGPAVEPVGVIAKPGVVGRALDREVEGDLQVVLPRRHDQALELGQRAEVGVHGRVPSGLAPDRPRASGVAGLRDGGVVAPLAVGDPDRVDRRQVDDVEAQLGQPRELLLHAGEAPEGAREQLVPRADAGPLAVDVHLVRRRPPALVPLGAAGQRLGHGRRGGGGGALGHGARRAHRADRLGHRGAVARAQPPGGVLDQDRSLLELALEVLLAGRQLALDLVPPRRVGVHPGLDLEAVAAQRDRGERPRPPVRAELRHRLLQEPAGPRRTVPHDGPQLLVAVAHEVARDDHGITEGALHGLPATVHRRPDVVDLKARWRRAGNGDGHEAHAA